MRSKKIVLVFLIATMALAVIPTGQVSAQPAHKRGPKMDNLHVINYGGTDPEFAALQDGDIDLTDWPLTSFWIKKWITEGRIPSEITIDPLASIDSWEVDIYCQKWPTGSDGVAAREGYTGTFDSGDNSLLNDTRGVVLNQFHTRQRPSTSVGMDAPTYNPATQSTPMGNGSDYDPETSSWKTYFDEDCLWDVMAWGFRLAVAYTVDKDYVIDTVLEGLGTEMRAWATAPAQEGFLDINNLTNSWFTYQGPHGNVRIPSLVFSKNLTKAERLLDAAGFRDWDNNGVRNDPRKVAGADKLYGTPDDVTTAASDMSDIILYTRLDDPNREAMGLKLGDDLETNLDIPVTVYDIDRAICFRKVMIEYDYNIYTGGYSFGADIWEIQQSLWHSNQYWYPIGWSGGYQGFCHVKNDEYLDDVLNSPNFYGPGGIFPGVRNASYLQNKYACSVPVWSTKSAMAYRTGWDGVVNHLAYGISWGTGGVYYWSQFNMEKAGTNTINWGLHSAPESLSVVISEWVFDWEIIDLIYETLLVRNPYNLAEEKGMLAQSWSTGTWGGGRVYVDFTLKNNVTWHDGTKLTAQDVKWGLEFIKNCGSGVAWNYMMVRDLLNVTVLTPGQGGTIRAYFNTTSAWAIHLAGFLEFPSRKMWMNASAFYGWGYNPVSGFPDDAHRLMVRDYLPYKHDVYDPTSATPHADGIKDLAQDGTGPWVFVGVGGVWETIDLVAFRDHHLFQDEVEYYLEAAFNDAGNVNYLGSTYTYPTTDRRVDEFDMIKLDYAMFTNSSGTHGSGQGQYNVDCDFNSDNKVSGTDYVTAGRYYGQRAG